MIWSAAKPSVAISTRVFAVLSLGRLFGNVYVLVPAFDVLRKSCPDQNSWPSDRCDSCMTMNCTVPSAFE